MTYDLIGDVHGQHLRLTRVLEKLGYKKKKGYYKQKGHCAIFLGDLIDRGSNSAKTVELVKRMVENEKAEMIMGNHELNLWSFLNCNETGEFLREHSPKNEIQLLSTLRTYQGKEKLLDKHLNWISQLPFYLDKEGFRAIHACWDTKSVSYLKKKGYQYSSNQILKESFTKDKKLKKAIKMCLSGPVISLPDQHHFLDADGIPRKKVRYKWWEEHDGKTYRQMAVKPEKNIPRKKVNKHIDLKDRSYSTEEKNLFLGHYSMRGKPELIAPNLACLDWVRRSNRIAVYRYSGEDYLSPENLFWFY